MEVSSLLIIQIIADVILCAAALVLLWRFGKSGERRLIPSDDIQKLAGLLKESEEFSRKFLEDFQACRQLLEDVLCRAEEKQRVLESLLERTGSPEASSGRKYDEVAEMVKAGMTEGEISLRSELAKGEIRLIRDLVLRRGEV